MKACEHWNDDNGDNSRFRFAIFVLHELTQLQKYASLIMPISSIVGVCVRASRRSNQHTSSISHDSEIPMNWSNFGSKIDGNA